MSEMEPISLLIRDELPGDIPQIRSVIHAAFLDHPHHAPGALPTEQRIVDELRRQNALTLSVVAMIDDLLAGHVAYSEISIDGKHSRWLGLGPVSVHPNCQRRGIGKRLITTTLERLRKEKFDGVVVLGEPAYYSPFGFTANPRLVLENVPPEYFMSLPLSGPIPSGVVTYHPAFNVA